MSNEIKLCLSQTDEPNGGAWLTLPATASQLQEALQSIGADIGRQDFSITAFQTDIPAVDALLTANPDAIVNASLDELNYLAVKMSGLEAVQLQKLDAVTDSPYQITELERLMDYDFNTDCFVLIPEAKNPAELGAYYLYSSGMVDMPEEWKGGIGLERFGAHAAHEEMGFFTTEGYLLPTGDEWQHDFEDDRRVPDEYSLTGKEETQRGKPSIREQLTAAKEQTPPKTPEAKPHRSDPDLS